MHIAVNAIRHGNRVPMFEAISQYEFFDPRLGTQIILLTATGQ
jgi:hypothetical protein